VKTDSGVLKTSTFKRSVPFFGARCLCYFYKYRSRWSAFACEGWALSSTLFYASRVYFLSIIIRLSSSDSLPPRLTCELTNVQKYLPSRNLH